MIEMFDQWDVRPFRCRNNALSEYHSFIFTCNLIILIGQHIHTKTTSLAWAYISTAEVLLKADTIKIYYRLILKLGMDMRNVLKRQQPDQKADIDRRPLMGHQCSVKLPHPEAFFSWPLNKNLY